MRADTHEETVDEAALAVDYRLAAEDSVQGAAKQQMRQPSVQGLLKHSSNENSDTD